MVKAGLAVTVPNHRSIVPKTLKSILHQAALTVEELAGEL
jgi:hypothetical protein